MIISENENIRANHRDHISIGVHTALSSTATYPCFPGSEMQMKSPLYLWYAKAIVA